MKSTIIRKKHGNNFYYEYQGDRVTDKNELERIKSLAIPPAWKDVEIAKSDKARVQAQGRDAKNRLQYIYHSSFQVKQAKEKFDRIAGFAKQLPKLRRQIEKDLARKRFDKRKVLACAVSLMDETYIRIGNERYADENKSYGLTTLRSKHVNVRGEKIILDFNGKSGQRQHKVVKDAQLARLIKKLDEMPGYELFTYYETDGHISTLNSADVNEYIKGIIGHDYSAKDFRTWGGTLKAYTELAFIAKPKNKTECKRIITDCVKKVAKKLGNTPAIARSSYIDPRVLAAYEKQGGFKDVKQAVQKLRRSKYTNHEERAALKLLMSAS